MMTKSKKLIKIAHSPDSDDAFMFYALKNGKIVAPNYDFDIERRDIEELNHLAKDEVYDITAISIHAYAHLTDHYALTSSGASMAEKDYGPLVVSKNNYSPQDLKKLTVAVPGEWTTAFLMLKLIEPEFNHIVVPFEEIMDVVNNGDADAGLIIHEGQLQYEKMGFKKILCLIDNWKALAGDLPLPLGGNAIKKRLGYDTMKELSTLQKESILYAMENPQEARNEALQFKRDLTKEEADKYLSWYANERTVDMGEDGVKAIELLFNMAYENKLIPKKINLEII